MLITGGARSGKSSYALDLAERYGPSRCFVATSPVTDPEMSDRIAAHKIERQGRGWNSVEEEIDLAMVIQKWCSSDVILIDCLTLWINNLMYRAELADSFFSDLEMRSHAAQLCKVAAQVEATVVMVTNEVGMGIVPENQMARRYRDFVGRCNAIVAAAADEVTLVSCGLPLKLK